MRTDRASPQPIWTSPTGPLEKLDSNYRMHFGSTIVRLPNRAAACSERAPVRAPEHPPSKKVGEKINPLPCPHCSSAPSALSAYSVFTESQMHWEKKNSFSLYWSLDLSFPLLCDFADLSSPLLWDFAGFDLEFSRLGFRWISPLLVEWYDRTQLLFEEKFRQNLS